MSEFKGTKGKWRLEQSLFYITDKVILSEHRAICRVTIEDEESKANALLISKAPEILEMLIDAKQVLEDAGFNAELIIKEATEI